jgi:GINS complex subunit 2|mmetsp:Transcript_6327/g.18771  ORF Transcript_6327/g.18771 Transcript_6327/m.18771 type:complete len:170 (+) Transcript_6327:350-859(+)
MHQEVEFIAEDIMVEVTPNFASPTQREVKVLLFKNISSFEAQSRKHIPLWLALSLKKRSKCSIAIPDWLKTENLDAILKAEQREKELQKIHFHYIEVAHSLCKYARDDISDWSQVYDLVESIRCVRKNKIFKIFMRLKSIEEMENISASEISSTKPLFSCSKNTMLELQ